MSSQAEKIASELLNPIIYGDYNYKNTIVQVYVKPLLKETYIWFEMKSKFDKNEDIDLCNQIINYSKKAFKYYLQHRHLLS